MGVSTDERSNLSAHRGSGRPPLRSRHLCRCPGHPQLCRHPIRLCAIPTCPPWWSLRPLTSETA
uniref:Uncharacterized protein n=1 Tax=Arundo donax TaxID=35708 RepID=A0A0A9GCM7_ARUDO